MRLIFDFDGTITEKDTISTFAQAALAYQADSHGKDLSDEWKSVVKAYMDDFQQYKDTYYPPEDQRTSVADEVKFLSGSEHVETTSLDRVDASGVFSGLEERRLFQFGVDAVQSEKVIIREGFEDLIQLAGQRSWGLGIISVNWSASFITGVLINCNFPIVSNNISKAGRIIGPNFLGHRLTNSSGKLAALRHHFTPKGEQTIYFGDSITDLECILQGGIAIGKQDSELIRALRRIGFPVPHVGEVQEANIFWARGLREVLDSDVLERWGK